MNIKEFPPSAITANIRPDQLTNGFDIWWHPPTGEINWGKLPGYEKVGSYRITPSMDYDAVLHAVREDLLHLKAAA